MSWMKLSDDFWRHSKTEALGSDTLAAVGLWTLCLSRVGELLSDGRVTRRELVRVSGLDQAEAVRVADRLVAVGLWDRDGADYVFHDFTAYNPTRAQVEAARTTREEITRAGGLARVAEVERDGARDHHGRFTSRTTSSATSSPAGESPAGGPAARPAARPAPYPVSRIPYPGNPSPAIPAAPSSTAVDGSATGTERARRPSRRQETNEMLRLDGDAREDVGGGAFADRMAAHGSKEATTR